MNTGKDLLGKPMRCFESWQRISRDAYDPISIPTEIIDSIHMNMVGFEVVVKEQLILAVKRSVGKAMDAVRAT